VPDARRDSRNLALDSVLRWPTPKSKVWTTKFLHSAFKNENVIAVIAIGSAVRPKVSSADLDLVVICRYSEKLKDKPPIEVDLRAYEADQVDTLISSGNDLLGWAVKYGRALFQRNGFWDHVLTSWRDRVPLPSFDVAVQRANDAYRRLSEMLELRDYDAAYEQALSYVTHLARAELLKKGKHPASRPELSKDLRALGDTALADSLERLIDGERTTQADLAKLLENLRSKKKRPEIVSMHSDRNSAQRRSGRKR
jgi:HEPN domain-containing protein